MDKNVPGLGFSLGKYKINTFKGFTFGKDFNYFIILHP